MNALTVTKTSRLRSKTLANALEIFDLSEVVDRDYFDQLQAIILGQHDNATEDEPLGLHQIATKLLTKVDALDSLSLDNLMHTLEGFQIIASAFDLRTVEALDEYFEEQRKKSMTALGAYLPIA